MTPRRSGRIGPDAPCILSIDLACADWQGIGAALVGPEGARIVVAPDRGRPTVEAMLRWIRQLVPAHGVTGICIDGPLGWRAPDGRAPHSREAERAVRAPGKTGLPPDGVKPHTYLAFTRFSIALFEQLTMVDGWRLPGQTPDAAAVASTAPGFVTECFPTAIWRGLGLVPLKAKARATADDVAAARARLEGATAVAIGGAGPAGLTHDQLQAVVGGVAALRWVRGDPSAHLAGVPPQRLDGSWREGYILTLGPASDSVPSSPAAHVSVLPS